MKKLYILCAAALGLAFTACDEVEDMTGLPQTNPQEAPFGTDAVAVTPGNSAVINLQALNASGEAVELAAATLTGAPEGYTVVLEPEMAKTDDFAGAVALEAKNAAGTVSIATDALQDVYYSSFTKDPREATVYIRYAAYAVTGNTSVRLGGPDYFYGPYPYSVKPFDAAKEIADGYTLEIAKSDDFSDAMTFAFANTGVSPYDDPAFKVTAMYSDADYQAGLKWRIVSSTGVIYGPAGGTDASGDLLEGVAAGNVVAASPMLMDINMLTDTYDYKQAYTCLYTPGTANGWSAAASQTLTTDDYVNYKGLVSIIGDGFKFNPDTDWLGKDFGLGGTLEKNVADNGIVTYTGKANGGGNIKPDVDGLYYVEINFATKDMTLTYMSTIGIIGGFNGWGESLALTPSADFRTWVSAPVEFPAGCEWKFRANNDWAHNWGTDASALVFNGGNIVTAEAGTYIVTFNCSSVPYTAVLAKQ